MTTTYGYHNRAPITTVCAPTCQYTLTELGKTDPRCVECREKAIERGIHTMNSTPRICGIPAVADQGQVVGRNFRHAL